MDYHLPSGVNNNKMKPKVNVDYIKTRTGPKPDTKKPQPKIKPKTGRK